MQLCLACVAPAPASVRARITVSTATETKRFLSLWTQHRLHLLELAALLEFVAQLPTRFRMFFERRPQLKSRRDDVCRVTGDHLKLIQSDEAIFVEISLFKNLSKSLDAHLDAHASRHDYSVSKLVVRRRAFLRICESLVSALIAQRIVQNVFKLFHRHRSGIILIKQAPRKVHVRLRARVVELRQTEHEFERAYVPVSRDVEQGHHPRQKRVRRAQSKHFRKLFQFNRPASILIGAPKHAQRLRHRAPLTSHAREFIRELGQLASLGRLVQRAETRPHLPRHRSARDEPNRTETTRDDDDATTRERTVE